MLKLAGQEFEGFINERLIAGRGFIAGILDNTSLDNDDRENRR